MGDAVAAAGFRELRSLAWGHYLYVDDVSTLRKMLSYPDEDEGFQ